MATLVGLVLFGLGAGTASVVESLYWQEQLKVQLAEKDRLVAGLRQDLDQLRSGVGALKETNANMRGLIESSLKDSGDVARSNKSSVEKLRAIIVRLEHLRTDLSESSSHD